MKHEIAPTSDDFKYFSSCNDAETERIISGMTSIIDANEDKLAAMQNQDWFKRIWLTVSGKNKATVKEMEENRNKLAAYSVQVFAKFIEEKCISDAVISNLAIRSNDIYSSHLELQGIMYEIVNNLNVKIDGVDNYNNLITDIQNDKYSYEKIFVSLLEILSLLDKQMSSNKERLIRIRETMEKGGFDFHQNVSIIDFAEQILALPEESIGRIHLFTQNHMEFIFIRFACCLIEQYYFEPISNRAIIKENAVKTALRTCGLKGIEICDIDAFYNDIKNSTINKFAMLKETITPNGSPVGEKPGGRTTGENESQKGNTRNNQDFDILSSFSLTPKQTALLFSIQLRLARNDAAETNEKNKNKAETKKMWIHEWKSSVEKILKENGQSLIERHSTLIHEFREELKQSDILTWYNLIILEAVTFKAYFPLDDDKDKNKVYAGLKYGNQMDLIKKLIAEIGFTIPEIAEEYLKMYKQDYDKATGKIKKIVGAVISVVVVTALIAATAGAFAGPIAVSLFGAQFAGLHGAALVSACLAFAGGGAIAVGGAGMAGGALVIVGGGALLGAAAGGAGVVGFSLMTKVSPTFVLSQAVKLSVVLKSIVLTEQNDVGTAQKILSEYKVKINEMKKEISYMKLAIEQDKLAIDNLKKSIDYLEKIYNEMENFYLSFKVGLSI